MQPAPTISPDGKWEWNGTAWIPRQPAQALAPPTISPDGKWEWNGAQWVPYYLPARPYESAHGRGTLAAIFLGVSMIGIVLLGIAYVAIDLEPVNPSDTEDLLISLATLVGLVAWLGSYVAAAVFFARWLHRVVRNMPALGSPDPRWTPSGAVWRCFLPIVWLAHPLLSVIDAWRGSDPSRRVLTLPERKAIATPGLMGVWWTLWLGGNLVVNIASRIYGPTGAILDSAGSLAILGAAVCAIWIVQRLTERQDHKHELIASGQLA